MMPGDAFSILEACASANERGLRAPKVVTCLHEIVAVAAAQRANISTDHPMYLGSNAGSALSSADLLLF
jgi:hypothetical protein